MPILQKEVDLYPDRLLEDADDFSANSTWSVVYTMSRREKEFMRQLHRKGVGFYCPIVEHKSKSPAGRVRTSHLPLFSNYVFVHADPAQRLQAFETNCISKWIDVNDGDSLRRDLQRIHRLMQTGAQLALEPRLPTGQAVRIRSGIFEGQEGVVVRHDDSLRLIIAVNFLQQGASVLLDDADVDPV